MSVSAFLLFAPPLTAQVALAPVSVTLDSLNEDSPATQLFDQSGLSATYTSGTTDFSTAISATHSNASDTRWLSVGDKSGSMTFDLGSAYQIYSFALWNMAGSSSQAVETFTIETSLTSDFTDSVTVGSFTATNTGDNDAVVAQTFTLTTSAARYVRWNITDSFGNSIVAAKEILFSGLDIGDYDDDVTATMDSGGIFTVGIADSYTTDFGGSSVVLGSTTDDNSFSILNGAVVALADEADFTIGSDNNSLTVSGSGSELRLHYDASAVLSIAGSTDGNTISVQDGGLIETGDFNVGASATGNTVSVTGTDSTFRSLGDVDIATGGELTLEAGSGGTLDLASINNLGTLVGNLNNGGTFQFRSAIDIADFDTWNFNSGGTLVAQAAISNLPDITSGRTVDITSGGSFATATTLAGGTLRTAGFDYSGSNLTFTSGTIAPTGDLANLPTLSANMSIDLTAGGAFGDITTLDGGSVVVGEFDFSTSNLTFTSGTLSVSGDLTNFARSSTSQLVRLNSGAEWQAGDVTDLSGITISGGTLETEDLLSGQMAIGNVSGGSSRFTSGTVKVTGDFVFDAAHAFDIPFIATGRTLDLSEADSITFQNISTTFFYMDGGTLRLGTIDSPHDLVEVYTSSDGRVEFTGAVTNLNVSEWSTKHEIVLDGGTLSETQALDNYDVTIQNGGHLTVDRASYNTANLTFTNGTLTATGSLTNLPTLVANTTVDLSGGGSFGDATTLDGGTVVTGAFNFSGSNLTFTSGTLEVSDALTNLNALSSGQAINLNGASATWSPSGDIDDGAVTLQNDASLTVGDYDASNLTFTSGSITTDGALTNLNSLSSSDQIVTINGASATWSPTGNINAGSVTLTEGSLTVNTAFDASNFTFNTAHGGGPLTGTLTMTTGALTNLNTLPLSAGVVLDGDSSWAPTGDVSAGYVTLNHANASLSINGDFDSRFITFNAGTLNTNGTISELNSLSTGQAVVMNGGSWSPTGDIDDGSLTLQNSAALTTSDFDASNLTFTSGSITTDGALTNLSSLNANNTVTIDGSGASWSPTGNIDAGTVNLTEGSLTLNTSFDASNLTFASEFGAPVALLTMNTGTLSNLNILQVGQRVTLNGDSAWSPAGNIEAGETVLNSADAQLTTSGNIDGRVVTFNAGTFTVTGTLSELNSLSSSDQTVELSGGSAAWSPTGSISTGNVILDGGTLSVTTYDATNLSATSGTLNASGSLTNLPTIAAGIAIDITSGGSIGDATTLNGGSIAADDFDASNLTFTAGSLQAAGTLTGLTDLANGTTARVDGSDALALVLNETLALDGGTLEVANGADATALGSGAITFDGTNGGSIALDNGTLNVASMGTALTLNANATITGNGSIYGDIALGVGGTIDGDVTGLEVFGHISGSGTLADVTLFGNLDIGNSPGDVALQNTTLSSNTIVALAIEGAANGEFDTFTIDADSDVSTATLAITFENYTPESISLSFALVSNSSGTNFANVSTPEGWTFSNGLLSASAVPEPSSFALLGGLLALGFTATRRRGRGRKVASIE